ncbi:MAG: DUF1127 domain-containing protein [Pseudomonadota bacterium]
MTTTTYDTTATFASLQGRLGSRLATLRADWAKWRQYRKTVNELSALSTRDLDDLGIARGMIRSIALEAAYGK